MSTQLSESAQTRRAVSNILKGSAGNLVEWFDVYIYTAFSAYFAVHFFSSKDPLQSNLEAMAVFAVTFLMRPIGAWFFGRYADRNDEDFAALEAAACGLPVVVGNSGGAPETVKDGETGFVVPSHDHQQFAERLGLLLSNPSLAQQMGARGRRFVCTHFSTESARATLREGLDL